MKIYIKLNRRLKKGFVSLIVLSTLIIAGIIFNSVMPGSPSLYAVADGKKFIRWVDFNVSLTAMKQAMKIDIDSAKEKVKINWIDLLSIAACKNGGHFSEKTNQDIISLEKRLRSGEKISDITKNLEYYNYYKSAYSAVLSGFVGKYRREEYNDNPTEKTPVKTGYGLIAYSPIAYGYSYSHSDDFGSSRSYGFKRTHQGNDLMGSVGTPLIAVENGIVECMGWNKYGGWRIGIRSLDFKRYYYYAHLRKNHPYVETLKEGMEVKAGDVIGYLGMTGYSDTEDHNGMNVPHLHFGIQLIFDESQKDGNGEIWIDVYKIVKLLQANRSVVYKDEKLNEYVRKYKEYAVV